MDLRHVLDDRLIWIIVSVPEKPEVSTLVPRYRDLMEHVLDISCERKWAFPEPEDYTSECVVPVRALKKMIVQTEVVLLRCPRVKDDPSLSFLYDLE